MMTTRLSMDMLEDGYVNDLAAGVGSNWNQIAWKCPGGVTTKNVEDRLGPGATPLEKSVQFFALLVERKVSIEVVCKAIRDAGFPVYEPSAEAIQQHLKPGRGIAPPVQQPASQQDATPNQAGKDAAAPDFTGRDWFDAPRPVVVGASLKDIKASGVKVQVILHTVNDTEFFYMLKNLEGVAFKDRKAVLQCVATDVYFVGRCGNYDAVIVQGTAGSMGASGSTLVVQRAIEVWGKLPVISVGVACGRGGPSQQLGDVLIASEIIPYESARVGTTATVPRGVSFPAHHKLFASFRNLYGWTFLNHDNKEVKRIPGRVLSGEKLVDDDAFKKSLFEQEPEAVGVEMEGSGAISIVQTKGVPYLLVKGICDWGDGHKHKGFQPLAAAAAASLVKFVCSTSDTLDDMY